MSNDVAVRPMGWTPDGETRFDCQQDRLGVHLEIAVGFDETPTVRGDDTVIPGLAGRIPGNRVADELSILLAGNVRGDLEDGSPMTELERRTSYRVNVLALQAAFDPTLRGVIDVLGEDGYTYTIAARPLSIVYGPEIVPGERQVSVALVSTTSPYWTRTPPGGS